MDVFSHHMFVYTKNIVPLRLQNICFKHPGTPNETPCPPCFFRRPAPPPQVWTFNNTTQQVFSTLRKPLHIDMYELYK